MEIKSFKYTKANGDVSNRDVLVITNPSNMVRGIDITELPDEDQVQLASDVSKAYDEFLKKTAEIYEHYDVRRNFRQFDVLKMTDVESIYVGDA